MDRRLLSLSAALLAAGCAQLPPAPVGAVASVPLDGSGYPVQVCDANYAGVAAQCTISGDGPFQLLRGNVISDGKLYVGGTLLISPEGKVATAGCAMPRVAARIIDCPGALVSAGLLNLHEHIDYSYQQPPAPPTLKWVHRHEWRKLLPAQRGFEGDAPKDPVVRTEVSERAMLRHMLTGSTAISGAKDYRAFLRNLKLADGALATPTKPVIDSTFPLNDAGSMQWPSAPCTPEQVAQIKVAADKPFIPHVGEGTNAGAGYEVDCVLDAVKAKPTANAFIHGVAISEAQIARLKAQDVAVVLSPRSNFRLYGATAPLPQLKAAGVTLAMGTDWSPSGSLSQLDEARCLMRYNRDKLADLFSWADVHAMMTSNGARAVGLQGQIGKLAPGEWADVVMIDTEGRRDLGAVLANTALKQTLAVMVGGRFASYPTAWGEAVPRLDRCASDPRDLCGQQRTVCGAAAERSLGQLLKQPVYTINESSLCAPASTEDCVVR
ncbi:amidohydrolase family protein [Chitinimonas sp. BJYL2]|uniref:amidohydrolase family protein n=1 Tax=Chitinimonas sp. BJYL2 TaxID=2976696 RepID=UPI0022B499DA|nr:amidohydrolase family protein [Chitinimonas sp. BJYL2]